MHAAGLVLLLGIFSWISMVRAEAPKVVPVQLPKDVEKEADVALRKAFRVAIQRMGAPHKADEAQGYAYDILREVDKKASQWRLKLNDFSIQLTTAQKFLQKAEITLSDKIEKIHNLEAEIAKKKARYDGARAVDAEYQQQIAAESKWQIVVPFDITYPYEMEHGHALDQVYQHQLGTLIELGRGVHLRATDVVEDGMLKQSLVIADVSGKLLPEGETIIQKIGHADRALRRILAVRTFNVLPLLPDEQLTQRAADHDLPPHITLNNRPLSHLTFDDEARISQVLSEIRSARMLEEITAKVKRVQKHNKEVQHRLLQILENWQKIRTGADPLMLQADITQAEQTLAAERALIPQMEELKRQRAHDKYEAEHQYLAHLHEYRVYLSKAGAINVGELNVIHASVEKAIELYKALEVEANQIKHQSITQIEDATVTKHTLQQEKHNLKLLELLLLPIGSNINDEGQEIIHLTLLGTYVAENAGSETSVSVGHISPSERQPGPSEQQPAAEPVGQALDKVAASSQQHAEELAAPQQQREARRHMAESAGQGQAPKQTVPDAPQRAAEPAEREPQKHVSLGGPIRQRIEIPSSFTPGQLYQAQEHLQEVGLEPGPADGVLGPRTKAALRQYQERHNLPPTGEPDESTRTLLQEHANQVRQQKLVQQALLVEQQRQESERERQRREAELAEQERLRRDQEKHQQQARLERESARDRLLPSGQEKIGPFIKYSNGTALDTRTGLMWMTKDFRNIEGTQGDWKEAMVWVHTMNQQRYGGYSDWRVPTTEEYEMTYDHKRSKKSYSGKPVGYPEVFEDGGGVWFWSRTNLPDRRSTTPGMDFGMQAYGFQFYSGRVGVRNAYDTSRDLSIRLVRDQR